jgi:uncharacterized repeat protein (TIGR03806 family)
MPLRIELPRYYCNTRKSISTSTPPMYQKRCYPPKSTCTSPCSRFQALHLFGFSLVLIVLGLFSAPGQTVFLDFNSVNQYTNNFNPWNDTGGNNGGNYSFAESTTAGVSGSGGISVFQSADTTAAYKSGSWDFSTNGSTIILSLMVKANGLTSGNKVQFGIMNTNYSGLNSIAGTSFETFRFAPTSATVWSLREQYRTNNTTAAEVVLGNMNVVSGRWYKFVVSLTNTSGASGNCTAGCAIYDYGTDGQTPGTNIVTFNTVQTHLGLDIAKDASVWPALRAFQSAGISAWDNFLVYRTNSRPVITVGLTNVTGVTGQTVNFNTLADGPGTIAYSWYTNKQLVAGASGTSYTTPALTTAYTNVMAVAANVNGSVTNQSVLTVQAPSVAQITNLPATTVQSSAATLNGQVIFNGGSAATVTLYYGPSNGGTNPAAWAQNVVLGVQNGAFAQIVSGLSPTTTYYYAAKAVNGIGTSWATPSQSFTTLSQVMTPIALSGFNRDVIIENNASGPPYSAAALEFNPGEGTAFYQSGLPGKTYGLPVSGAFTSVVGDGTQFQLQPYTNNNALVLSSETGITTGTLTLLAAVTYSRIAIIAHSGSGGGTPNVTLHFSDNSTYTTTYNAQDWFFNTGFALQGFDRININSGATSGGPNDPRFYQTTLDLSALLGGANKPLASLSFDQAAGSGATGIYAVSGLPQAALSAPSITNSAASSIQAQTATLAGQVLSTGGETPTVTLYYGPTNGGTNTGSWVQSVSLGLQGGSFSQPVTGLSASTVYYFIARAVNSVGTAWAVPSQSFTTLTPSLPVVTNLPATGIQATVATLNGQVLATGGDAPTVTLFYGPTNGGTNPAAWSQNISQGIQSGVFAQSISGLASNATYYYTARAVNAAGTSWAVPSQSFSTLATNPVLTGTAVLTYRNDNTRWGVNTNETNLTLANVNTNNFGRLFEYNLDGFVYAQPLVMTNVTIPGKGVHNVVYVVTEHESVYAFDADSNSGPNVSPLWQTSFLGPGVTTVPNGDVGTTDITPEVGITATPVIDPVSGTIYIEAKTKEGTAYVHRLHALDIATGLERTNFNSPVVISATNYPGTGSGGSDTDGTHVLWNPLREHCRPALTLLNGNVYLAYASHGDNGPYHGWIFAYDADTLAQTGVYNATPNGGLGGFWQGGGGPSVDDQGNLYLQTGNGSFNGTTNVSSSANYAMSVLKFATTNGITLVDYFAPSNAVSLSGSDQDLGSSAPIILPDSAGSAAHPHLVVGGGKTPPIYIMDRDNMGRFNGTTGSNNIVQQFNGGPGGDRNVTPAFFNNTLYVMGSGSRISAFKISNGIFNTTPVQSPDAYGNKGGASVIISANGTNNAIAWALQNSGGQSPVTPCVLRAYNATNIAQELYTSDQLAGRDAAGNAVKFITPTVANGKVYVGAQYKLSIYGVGFFLAPPTIAPNGGTFSGSVTVTLSDATPGTTIRYTTDTTDPTTNSILYTAPFVLTNSTLIKVRAFKPGAADSAVVSATFINSSAIGNGTGLLGSYYSNQVMTFIEPATLVRTDAVVNFNWGGGSPDPSISADDFTVRWTGIVQPQFNETYTFYTTTDDGVRLWVNNQLLIDQWVDQGPTLWSGSIALLAQQKYNIRMEYYENGGGAQAMLEWSSPSTTQTIIPQTQLYPVSNPPPVVVLTGPTNGATYTATASVTLSANADAPYNAVTAVDFYVNNTLAGRVTNSPYILTTTGLTAGGYNLKAVAFDTTGLAGTSAPVSITVTSGSGAPYGLTSRSTAAPFLNMPATINGSLPATLSQTGVFTNTPNMQPAASLTPYTVNVPLWSDAALKTRWLMVPNSGAPYTPDEQISFAANGEWTFPTGTIFVKHFDLVTDETNPAIKRRLETRLLVRDPNGSVYGVTYKWRSDNSDADLLAGSLNEDIIITNASGIRTQTWYYPSPADCLACHTPAANYVLGVKTRQLNGNYTYPSTGQTDNQLRALNRVGLFYPAINESSISSYAKLSALTNLSASLEERSRSYLDANCAQCHRPGGGGPTMDARYDTPLTNQNIINAILAKGDLGYDNARVVVPKDWYRSVLWDRMNTVDSSIKMPNLARNLIDTNAVGVIGDWINSLPGTPALLPPTITPAGGTFASSVNVSLIHADTNAALHYTLDGSLPTTNSTLYTGPFALSSSATVRAKAFESGFNESVATTVQFIISPTVYFTSVAYFTNNQFQLQLSGAAGLTYILQGSTNLVNWVSVNTNTPLATPFYLVDPTATNYPSRFYRAIQMP